MIRKKINLLHLVQTLNVGGAEVLLIYYIKALGCDYYNHYVYCFGSDGPIRRKIEKLGVPVNIGPPKLSIKNPFKFAISLINLINDLLRFIRNEKITILQSHLGNANQLGVVIGKIARIPAFPTVHNTMAFVDRRNSWDLRIYLIKVVDAVVYRIADKVITISDEVGEIVQDVFKLSPTKTIVLKNGIIKDGSIRKSTSIKDEFKEDSKQFKAIAVGSLTYQKAFEVLIRAVDNLANQLGFKNILVMVVGEGSERNKLERLISDLKVGKYIRLLGVRHDVIDLMEYSDIFVMPSRYEGLSIAMIEAMSCGLPIIASDAPGLRNYIQNEKNGLLFPVEAHDELSERINRILNNNKLRSRLAINSRLSFEKEFDMRNNIKSLDVLLKNYAAVE